MPRKQPPPVEPERIEEDEEGPRLRPELPSNRQDQGRQILTLDWIIRLLNVPKNRLPLVTEASRTRHNMLLFYRNNPSEQKTLFANYQALKLADEAEKRRKREEEGKSADAIREMDLDKATAICREFLEDCADEYPNVIKWRTKEANAIFKAEIIARKAARRERLRLQNGSGKSPDAQTDGPDGGGAVGGESPEDVGTGPPQDD